MIDEIASDVVTETTHVSFGQKLIGSIFGALFGVLLLIGSGVGLFWNEGRAVTTARSLAEGAGQVASVEPNRVAAENEGKLVHVTGPLMTTAPLTDPELGASAVFAAVILAAIVAPMVIAAAWLWYRPLVALAVMAAGLGIAYLARMIAPRGKTAVPQPRVAAAAAR